MNFKIVGLVALVFFITVGCQDDTFIPKPKAMLRLEYPRAVEAQFQNDDFSFNYNLQAKPLVKNKNAIILEYPEMKGAIFITHKKIENNLDKLIADAQKLSFEHLKKADNITPRTFMNEEAKVYGTYFQIIGDAASPSQFYLTDSINHFVTGSTYFYTKPNYDSILPAATYLQADMRAIMETMQWREYDN
jgi:gliding motility-associated lipoprotein GldD